VAAPAAFLAIAVAGLAERVAIWRSARRTQADMVELSQRLEELARVSPLPALPQPARRARETSRVRSRSRRASPGGRASRRSRRGRECRAS